MASASPVHDSIARAGARVALVGNPNTGKSTLFNALAGMNVRTGNYPGVTIEKKVGRCSLGSQVIELVDLPGTYSLAPRSPDELVAVQVLTDDAEEEPGVELIVCVVNALLLQRNLFLVSQLLELGKPVIIALNMIDVAESRKISIDVNALSKELGVPVVATSAAKRTGIDELKSAIAKRLASDAAVPRLKVLPDEFYDACGRLRDVLAENQGSQDEALPPETSQAGLPDDYLIERMLLDRGGEAERRAMLRYGDRAEETLTSLRKELSEQVGDPIDMECNARYAWARKKLVLVMGDSVGQSAGITDRIDAILTHRIGGLVCFVALMFLIFQSIYSFASWPMDLIDAATGLVSDLVVSTMPPGMLRSLITDGVIAGVGGVLIFLPQIALLFLFLALLEDCGYMARAAFLVDRIMTTFGLSGKSFLPMMSSFACAVPGVMASRVIENRRDRFATIMVAPLMSCSARLPVYLLLIAAFIPGTTYLGGWLSLPAIVLMSMYMVGVVVAIPVAWILKKTLLRGEVAPFVLELPEYKFPSVQVVLSRVWSASKAFVIRAGTLIFAASILIWFAGYWPGDHTEQYALQRQIEELEEGSPQVEPLSMELHRESARLLEESTLGRIGHGIEPVVRPLGWDWKIGVGAVASFPAREVIIATLGTIYSLGGDAEEEGLVGALRASKHPDGRPVYSVPVALSIMVFFALCAQCVSTLLVIRRETNSWFWPILSFVYMTGLAYIGALVTYQVGSRFL
ncbi:MAG: ferrous iron transport protein B [Rubripirellula sp.]